MDAENDIEGSRGQLRGGEVARDELKPAGGEGGGMALTGGGEGGGGAIQSDEAAGAEFFEDEGGGDTGAAAELEDAGGGRKRERFDGTAESGGDGGHRLEDGRKRRADGLVEARDDLLLREHTLRAGKGADIAEVFMKVGMGGGEVGSAGA